MSEQPPAQPPIPPFKEAVAERAKVTRAIVDRVLREAGVVEEKATRRADHLALRRLSFSGEKQDTHMTDGQYTFLWEGLAPGLWGVLSDGANQIGKSTVIEVMLWALRGRVRSLKSEVREWINEVELEFTIGQELYCVSFTDFGSVPRGKLVMTVPGPPRTLDTFEGDEAFERLMGELMMRRFVLQPIPNISHMGDEANQYFHAWAAYAASMFIEGSHPAILGDVTVGALWWRMLHLFVGMPYAATHMALRNALTLEQAKREGFGAKQQTQRGYDAKIKRLEEEEKRISSELDDLPRTSVTSRELDSLTKESATLTRSVSELQERVASAQVGATALKAQRDEARATLRRLHEGAKSRKVFAGLNPVCCPRCASAFPPSQVDVEEAEGRCAVCNRSTLGKDEGALQDALQFAGERLDGLTRAENEAQKTLGQLQKKLKVAETRRTESAAKIREVERQTEALRSRRELEDSAMKLSGALDQLRALASQDDLIQPDAERVGVLKAAEAIAENRMKSGSLDQLSKLEAEVTNVAQRFGFRGLEAITIRGNGITLTVSGVRSTYSKQTAGQKLRLRVALVTAMMRLAHRSGFGHHPGLLLIDAPGSEELSDTDLLAMMTEIGQVASETPNLQVFVASARGDVLRPAFETANVRLPDLKGAIF